MSKIPVVVRRWDDTNAPVIASGIPSEYLLMIKQVFVDGYGATPGLGWSVVVDEISTATPYLVITNANNSGYIEFSAPDDVNYNSQIKIAGYLDYVDKNTTGRPTPFTSAKGYGSSATTLNSRWFIVGHANGAYLTIDQPQDADRYNYLANRMGWFFYMGEMKQIHPNDTALFNLITGEETDEVTADYRHTFNYGVLYLAPSSIGKSYPLDGSNTPNTMSVKCSICAGQPMQTDNSKAVDVSVQPGIIAPMYISQGVHTTPGQAFYDANNPFIRYGVPGVFQMDIAYDKSLPRPLIKDIKGQSHWIIYNSRTYSNMAAMNLVEW